MIRIAIDRSTMKTPVVLVAAALTAAILLAASFLIATGTRGDNALQPLFGKPAGASLRLAPAADDGAAPRMNSISFDSKKQKGASVRLAAL
jgi:hypothetical protein